MDGFKKDYPYLTFIIFSFLIKLSSSINSQYEIILAFSIVFGFVNQTFFFLKNSKKKKIVYLEKFFKREVMENESNLFESVLLFRVELEGE